MMMSFNAMTKLILASFLFLATVTTSVAGPMFGAGFYTACNVSCCSLGAASFATAVAGTGGAAAAGLLLRALLGCGRGWTVVPGSLIISTTIASRGYFLMVDYKKRFFSD